MTNQTIEALDAVLLKYANSLGAEDVGDDIINLRKNILNIVEKTDKKYKIMVSHNSDPIKVQQLCVISEFSHGKGEELELLEEMCAILTEEQFRDCAFDVEEI